MVRKGRKKSKETKRKISEALKGHTVSEETKRKISKSRKGQEPCNKGKIGVYSKATKRKMSEAQKARKKSRISRSI